MRWQRFGLMEAPGFLNERIPERLTLLPEWMGPFRQLARHTESVVQ